MTEDDGLPVIAKSGGVKQSWGWAEGEIALRQLRTCFVVDAPRDDGGNVRGAYRSLRSMGEGGRRFV